MSGTTTPAGFAAELNTIAVVVDTAVGAVIKKGALNIKNEARSRAGAAHSNPGKSAAVQHINFDMTGKTSAEIGYDKGGPGSLGTFNEYGSAGNSPDNALGSAIESEAPKVAAYMTAAVDKLWR